MQTDFFSNFDGLTLLSNARSRSISAENPSGEKGKGAMCELENGASKKAARELGKGWKVNPAIKLNPNETADLANITGPGAIKHIWMVLETQFYRGAIIRFYWDNSLTPSVECPVADFFASGWFTDVDMPYNQISSLAVCVNSANAFNCYWTMPFRKNCRITIENRNNSVISVVYQIDYALMEIPDECAYFHAQFRRVNPLPYKDVYTIVDNIHGKGHYVGTFLAWGVNNNGWWGEGEIKFFIDGDDEYPTICGTGTEDYFCGSFAFGNHIYRPTCYISYSTPYAGFYEIKQHDEMFKCQKRFGMYRWHLTDPIRFERDFKVTIQALGWREGGRYLPMQDDIASVAFWYQTLPAAPFPALPDKDYLEII
jgi:hypothetical protein